jgi:glycine dehydrogenase subunit 2
VIRVGEYSTLAGNYLIKRLEAIGCQTAYPERRASHDVTLTAKRLLDYN